MKSITFLALLIVFFSQQKKVEGEYYDHFGNTLQLNSDSTFVQKYHVDLASSWSIGKWAIKHDTIYFKVIPVLDTLRTPGKNDTLVLSQTKIPRVINQYDFAIQQLVSGGQNRAKIDKKLFYKNGKLYRIDKLGKLDLRKVSGIMDGSIKSNTWFEKDNKP